MADVDVRRVVIGKRCQIPCCRERCLDPNLCSHFFERVLMMAQRCRLDIHRCVPLVGVARVEARGRFICLRGMGRRLRGHRMVVVWLITPNMTVCPAI